MSYLLLAQWCDHGTVVDPGLADHRLGELDLGCDVGQGDGVVVVVGDVQSVLEGTTENRVTKSSCPVYKPFSGEGGGGTGVSDPVRSGSAPTLRYVDTWERVR